MQEHSEMTSILLRAAWGVVAWIGGITLEDVSTFASALSYGAGAVWFSLQAYYLWKEKRRK